MTGDIVEAPMTDDDDIVGRLRRSDGFRVIPAGDGQPMVAADVPLMRRAADEIERLRADPLPDQVWRDALDVATAEIDRLRAENLALRRGPAMCHPGLTCAEAQELIDGLRTELAGFEPVDGWWEPDASDRGTWFRKGRQ